MKHETLSEDRQTLSAGAAMGTQAVCLQNLPSSPLPWECSFVAIQGRANQQEQGPHFLEADPWQQTCTRSRKMSSCREAPGSNEMDSVLSDCPLLCVIALGFYLTLLSSHYCCHLSPRPDGVMNCLAQ